MSDLGDLLVALHGGPRFRTLRGTVRSWNHAGRAMEALRRIERSEGSSAISIAFYGDPADDESAPETSETFERVWLELPDRARSESEHVHGSTTFRSTVVIQGDTWWSLHGAEITTNGGDPSHGHGLGASAALIDPAWTLAGAILVPGGETVVAGRRCLRAEARPRPRSPVLSGHPSALPGGETEIDVDRERGVVVRQARLLDGVPYSIDEFVEIAFDEALDPALFTVEPPPDAEVDVVTTDPFTPVALHEVVRAARFTVLASRAAPRGWELTCHHVEESRRGPESVFLTYRSADASAAVSVIERSAEEPEAGPAGDSRPPFSGYRVSGPDGDDWPLPRLVTFEREGTFVQLSSAELDTDALVAFAETFAPASAEPPRPV